MNRIEIMSLWLCLCVLWISRSLLWLYGKLTLCLNVVAKTTCLLFSFRSLFSEVHTLVFVYICTLEVELHDLFTALSRASMVQFHISWQVFNSYITTASDYLRCGKTTTPFDAWWAFIDEKYWKTWEDIPTIKPAWPPTSFRISGCMYRSVAVYYHEIFLFSVSSAHLCARWV